MDDQLYREIILEHWKNPQNAGVIENADVDLEEYNPLCGDKVRITATLHGNTLSHMKFQGEGCAISQACSDILADTVIDKSVDDILHITQKDFLEYINISLTPARLKCALLAYSTLQKALA